MLKLRVIDLFIINSYKKLIVFYKQFFLICLIFLYILTVSARWHFIFFYKKSFIKFHVNINDVLNDKCNINQYTLFLFIIIILWIYYIVIVLRQACKSRSPDVNPEVRMKDKFLHFLGVSRAIHRMLQAKKASFSCLAVVDHELQVMLILH